MKMSIRIFAILLIGGSCATYSAVTDNPIGDNEVQLCKRPADLPIKVDHHWLRTKEKEAGLGPANGEVPDRSPGISNVIVDTKINDHTGQHKRKDAKCETVKAVDPKCVNKELSNDEIQGKFPTTNCQNTAEKILKKCKESKSATKPAAKPKAKPATETKAKSNPKSQPRLEFREPIPHIREVNRVLREQPMKGDRWDRGWRDA